MAVVYQAGPDKPARNQLDTPDLAGIKWSDNVKPVEPDVAEEVLADFISLAEATRDALIWGQRFGLPEKVPDSSPEPDPETTTDPADFDMVVKARWDTWVGWVFRSHGPTCAQWRRISSLTSAVRTGRNMRVALTQSTEPRCEMPWTSYRHGNGKPCQCGTSSTGT